MRIAVLYQLFFACFFFLAAIQSRAQEGKSIKGIIIDSIDKTAIEKCTIIFQPKNGAAQKGLTTDKGLFSFTAKFDSALLIIKHDGYTELRLPVLIFEKQTSFDTIFLAPVNRVMEDIVIKAKVPPIVIRGDTTEFNIDSSMFEPYDAVEDLVKRLPGLEIDAEGKMTFQGKPITRILVDGEDLFGGDPTFSMKKIPAGMVAKIQVMDTKTLEQLFRGTPVDGEDKTLNIKLKTGVKTFGSADALAGTKNQLEGNGALSSFEEAKRLSVMGSFTSSNKIGIAKTYPGPATSASNASGNYGDKWGAIRFNASYSYNENSSSNELYRERTQLITADTSFFTRSLNRFIYESSSHRLSLNGNWFIDSSSYMDMGLSFSTTKSNNQNTLSSVTTENGVLRNESFGQSTMAGDYQTLGANLFWAKRLNRKGRSLSISARTTINNQDSRQLSASTNTYFKAGQPVSGDTLNRNTTTANINRAYSTEVYYSEPVSKALRINLRGGFDFNGSETVRSVYNLDSLSHTAEYDSLYSATILSSYNTQTFDASVGYSNAKQKWNITTGLTTVLQQTLRTLQKETIQQSLTRYSPSLSAIYMPSQGKRVVASFSATTIQPTIDQLQPVPDNSNPLYIRLGNPNLRTAFAQNYSISYNYYSVPKVVNASFSYMPVSNQIVNAVFYDEFRKQTSRYINVNGVYSMRGNISVSKTSRTGKLSKGWAASSAGTYGQQVYFQANQQYYSRNYSTRGEVSYSRREQVARPTSYTIAISTSYNRNWTPANTSILNTGRLNIAPRLEGSATLWSFIYATLTYGVWYNKINYHSALRRNDEYGLHSLTNNLTFQVGKTYSVQTAFTYNYNTQVPAGSVKGRPVFALFASAYLWKRKGQIKLSGVNLFSPKNDLQRSVGENYIEDIQMTGLQNYFTLRFQYNFNRIEKEKKGH